MIMILNNGTILPNTPDIPEKTREYLERFWKFPKKEDVEKEKEKYYIRDYKRYWQAHLVSNREANCQSTA